MIQNQMSKPEVRIVTAHIKDPEGNRFNYSGVGIVDRRSDMDIRALYASLGKWEPRRWITCVTVSRNWGRTIARDLNRILVNR
jgi:hypothetical protein